MRRRKLFKLAAFVPAILLVGPFIAYHAGAFEKAPPPAPQAEQQPEPPPEAAAGAQRASESPNPNYRMMYGSKSAPAFTPDQLGTTPSGGPVTSPQQPAPNQPPPTFMGGSKSMVILPTQPPADPPKTPVYMGGSKFKAVIGPNDLPATTQPAPPAAPNPPKP
jgi:hypothetical protein